MASLSLTIRPKTQKKIAIEVNAYQFERLAASFGFFSDEFLQSLARADKDYTSHKIRKISSLNSFRKK